MAQSINFNSIVTNSFNTNSGIFIGENNMVGWDSHSKRMGGLGAIYGQYNFIPNPYVLVNNNSVFDTMINDNDINTTNDIASVPV
ncbi:hypothetical protein [Gorillibacterium sp. sgz500922]|uniref:hypothetical protein n=1 Tax=Gorillibacterium sp. sgz500922 TaxID=3446694 RepID=UPI003F662037